MFFYNEEEKQLVLETKANNLDAFYQLLFKYNNLLKATTYDFKLKYYFLPLEFDDLYNNSIFIFFNLTKNYDLNSPKSFPLYIKTFLQFYLSNYIKKFLNKNNSFMNKFILNTESDFKSIENNTPDYLFEETSKIINNFNFLTTLEKSVINFLVEEKTPKEISKILDKKITAIYATIARSKRKIVSFYGL